MEKEGDSRRWKRCTEQNVGNFDKYSALFSAYITSKKKNDIRKAFLPRYSWSVLEIFSCSSDPSLEEVSELVFSACNHMKTSFGYGLDNINISSFFIKLDLPFLARPLAYFFIFSLQSGVFPDSWKTARVAPVYKESSKEERFNYRPISVLPVLARLFENLVDKQLYDYLDKNELIYRQQSGFRSLHSVTSRALYLILMIGIFISIMECPRV